MWSNLVAMVKTIFAVIIMLLGIIFTGLLSIIAVIVSAIVAAGLAICGLFLFFKK